MRTTLLALVLLPLLAAAPEVHIDHPGLVKLHWQQAADASAFREMTTFDMIDLLHEMDVHHIQLSPGQALSPEKKDVKIGPEMAQGDIDALLAKLKKVHMDVVSYGLADFGRSDEEARKVFEFGRKIKLKTFVSDTPPDLIPMLDKVAMEYQINVALTGDSPAKRYKTCDDALGAVKGNSKFMGVCADVAAWSKSGQSPTDCIEKCAGHVLLVTLSHVDDPSVQAKPALEALKAQDFKGICCLQDETENPDQRLQNFAKSVNAFSEIVTKLAK
jgi:hypothetical protein